MDDVLIENKLNVQVGPLDAALRAQFGAAISGMSAGWYGVRVHFLADNPAADQQSTARSLVAAHGSLALTADKTSIAADGSDTATITCAADAIAADANVTVTVWLDGSEYMSPADVPVSSERAQVTLATPDAGLYLIEFKRDGAPNQTGYLQIEAVS